MITIKTNCEFASELVCVIPYAYWLHQNNQLEGVITSKGMKPFYYFCDNVEEEFDYRTFDMNQNGLSDVPNNWIHHNAEAVFNKTYSELSKEEEIKANGVLNYSQWTPPPYKNHFGFWDEFIDLKPYVVISNNYNIEAGNDISETRRYFNLNTLSNMFFHLQEAGYNVVYKRPDNTEFAPDQNEIATLQGGHEFQEITQEGKISDYDLCGYYDNVYNLNDFDIDDYNEFQMKCFANADGFVTPNGGGGILCACFDKPVVFYVPSGKETRPGYLTNDDSYINKLSNADIHVTYNYSELLDKVKEVYA
tara:strand:+ start:1021 stop:1938 length:918 start_codon:yes stop_codon:yes gene_type:complete